MKVRAHRQSGQSLIESSLVLGAFMLLLVGMIALGQSLFIRATLADRARSAARWGALGTYDPAAIRRVALYGTEKPAPADTPFLGMQPTEIDVANPGCPGPQCGIRAVEPVDAPTSDLAESPAAPRSAP